MKTYECFGDRVDLRGVVLHAGDTIALEEEEAQVYIANDVPIRTLDTLEVNNDVTV